MSAGPAPGNYWPFQPIFGWIYQVKFPTISHRPMMSFVARRAALRGMSTKVNRTRTLAGFPLSVLPFGGRGERGLAALLLCVLTTATHASLRTRRVVFRLPLLSLSSVTNTRPSSPLHLPLYSSFPPSFPPSPFPFFFFLSHTSSTSPLSLRSTPWASLPSLW